MLPKYNDAVSCSGSRKRRIWTPHFIESRLGLAEYEIDISDDGEIDIFDAIQELSEYVDIDNIVKRFNNGEIDVLEKVQGFYGDLTTLPVDMRGIYDLNAQGKNLFDSLPEDVREQIGDYKSFMTMAAEKYNDIFKPKESEVIEDASEE